MSPDGKTLAFVQRTTGSNPEIWMLSLEEGGAKSRPFLQTRFFEQYAEFSPDGRWLVYASDESGRDEVYVQPHPGPGGRQQVSTEGGTSPASSRNGRELFYAVMGPSGAMLSRLWSGWRAAIVIVQPETVIAWHRRGFRLWWT